MRRTVPYEAGDLVAVPLQGGGYGVALVARAQRSGRRMYKHVFLYGFRDIYPEVSDIKSLGPLQPWDAVTIEQQGDAAIAGGEWPVLGKLPGFRREDWPIPPFIGGRMGRQIVWFDNPNLDMEDIDPELMTPEERQLLPKFRGFGGNAYLSVVLDLAIRRRQPGDYIEITEEIVTRWRGICAQVHKAIETNRSAVVKEPLRAFPETIENPVELELRFRLSNSRMGTPEDLDLCSDLEDRLEEQLERRGVGIVDTVETGRGYRRFILRGKDPEALTTLVRDALKDFPVRKESYMLIRPEGRGRGRRVELG